MVQTNYSKENFSFNVHYDTLKSFEYTQKYIKLIQNTNKVLKRYNLLNYCDIICNIIQNDYTTIINFYCCINRFKEEQEEEEEEEEEENFYYDFLDSVINDLHRKIYNNMYKPKNNIYNTYDINFNKENYLINQTIEADNQKGFILQITDL